MLFWIIVAALTAGVGIVLLNPLMRKSPAAVDDRVGEQAVYRDQLKELDRDLAGGLISPDQAGYARAEIGRRLLAVSDAARKSGPARKGTHWLAQSFVIVALPAIGLCLYLTLGHPGVPSMPLAARLANPGGDMSILVAQAERHLAKDPDDGKGWDVLAPVYLSMMRPADSELAYRNAIRLLGPTPDRLDGLAEALMTLSGGVVTDDARQNLEQALKLQPENPRARFYLALALEQDGKKQQAQAAFTALKQSSPPGAPWLSAVDEHIALNGGAPAPQAPQSAAAAPAADTPPADALGGPTAADVAASQDMAPADRQQMIRGMVDGLDAKLKTDPHNLPGWMRLIRSYTVLNEPAKAKDALTAGLAVFPADSADGQQLVGLAKELGLSMENLPQ